MLAWIIPTTTTTATATATTARNRNRNTNTNAEQTHHCSVRRARTVDVADFARHVGLHWCGRLVLSEHGKCQCSFAGTVSASYHHDVSACIIETPSISNVVASAELCAAQCSRHDSTNPPLPGFWNVEDLMISCIKSFSHASSKVIWVAVQLSNSLVVQYWAPVGSSSKTFPICHASIAEFNGKIGV